ncbi:site-specific integrase [Frankia sp. AgB1.8]|nr:site-specific integrase [Frankia sp. AgB1.8]
MCGCRDPETKRGYARGTCPKLSQRGHGYWEWRVRVPKELVALVGKPEVKGREKGKKAAVSAAEKAISEIRAGRQHVAGLTVGQYLDEWLEAKRRLRPTARRGYESNIRLYLRPLIGEVPLAGLRKSHLDAMYRRIEAGNATRRRPVGPSTMEKIHGTLRAALNDARDNRMIEFNPCAGVELPERTSADVDPWDATDVGRFLDEAADDRLGALYELVAIHGLRRGEACGVRWDDLVVDPRTVGDEDGPSGLLWVRQQITDSGGVLGVWAPKTPASQAKVDMDPTTLGSLMAWRLTQEQEREDVGRSWNNGVLPDESGKDVQLSGLIFTRPDGRHLAPEYVTAHMWHLAKRVGLCAWLVRDAEPGATSVVVGKRHAEPEGVWTLYIDREPIGAVTVTGCVRRRGAGAVLTLAEPLPDGLPVGAELGRDLLSRRRLHDLRHSSASIQLAAGVDITTISKRHRHSSPHITGTLYAHLLRPAGQAAARKASAAVPRRARCAQPVPSKGAVSGSAGLDSAPGSANMQVTDL